MGQFRTDKVGDFALTFPEYSGSKQIRLRPDIVEYDKANYDPKFDLIIGTNTMKELGIFLDFSHEMIMIGTIDYLCEELKKFKNPINCTKCTKIWNQRVPRS